MNLYVDIGNSFIKTGIFSESLILNKYSGIEELLNHINNNINSVVISSVVPAKTENLTKALYKSGIPFTVVDHSFFSSWDIQYSPVENLGIDRLLAACGAISLLNFEEIKERDIIMVIDSGTATTINICKPPNIFMGGLIAPGIETMFAALNQMTSQLPLSSYDYYSGINGNSTLSAISNGVINSCLGLIEKVYLNLNKTGNISKVYLTGGNASKISSHLPFPVEIVDNLVINGLKSIIS